ncbi:MAG: hypothetical protein GC180_05585 [Bacteroidetes bacterium]|nr:hypothetical protein [Bacteroidota bacterium]
MKLAKRLLILAVIMFGLNVFITHAQSTGTDTVCAGTTGKSYYVTATTGSTYNWTINGGTQASGGSTNSITVDWNNSTGTDTISVVETDSNGCTADPVYVAVVRMPNPTATISGTTTLCYNDSATVSFSLSGTYPLSLVYNDGSSNVTVNNISSSTYSFNTGVLSSSTAYSLVSISDVLGCSTSASGSANVTVLAKPVTSQIYH